APRGVMTHDVSGELTPGMRTVREREERESEPNEPPTERPRSGRRRAARRPPGRPGRAGRNLPAAIGVGGALGAIVRAALFVWGPAFLGVLLAAIAVGTWEMTRAVAQRAHAPTVPLLAGGPVMAGLAWYGGADALAVGLLATLLALLVWRLGEGAEGY